MVQSAHPITLSITLYKCVVHVFPLTPPSTITIQVTPRDYLETALLPVSGSGASVQAKNGIRASIKALFPDR